MSSDNQAHLNFITTKYQKKLNERQLLRATNVLIVKYNEKA